MQKRYSEIGQLLDGAGRQQLRMWTVDITGGRRPRLQHSHPQFELSTVLRGGGIYEIGGRQMPMEEGDVFVFAGNEPHWIEAVAQEGLEFLNLQFEPQYLWSHGADGTEGFPMHFWFHHSDRFPSRIPAAQAQPLRQLLDRIRQELTAQKVKYPLVIRGHLQELLVLLIREHGYLEETQTGSWSQVEGIQRVIRYLDTHIAHPVQLKELAAIANLSPNYFSALFHQECRVTLWEYIAARRVDMAAGLLLQMDQSQTMLDIALTCGFHNTANFNKAFRKYMGMTPSAYRRQAKEIPF